MNPAGPVVVGFDGSPQSVRAVQWAARMADPMGAPLIVVNSADRLRYLPDPAVGLWTPDAAHETALSIAQEGAQIAHEAAADLEITASASLGSPASALEELSAEARLVVVGNTGHGQVAGILVGSTAFHVATHAKCPVAVIPDGRVPQPGQEHKVSVATDGSPPAIRAVRHAADIAAQHRAPLEILTAWEVPRRDGRGMPPHGFPSLDQARDLRTEWAANFVQEAEREALREEPGLTVTARILEGRAQEVLAQAAADSAVLVVGARGRGDLKSLLLGSTSRAVLHHASIPVQIVR